MRRTPLTEPSFDIPAELSPFLKDAALFDSSCSPEARVIYIEKYEGFYLKRAAKGTLKAEAEMTDFFYKKGLGAEVVDYISGDHDFLLTAKVCGEDMTHKDYVSDPKRLCDTLASLLRELHETEYTGCPIENRCASYLKTVDENHKMGMFDPSYLMKNVSSLTSDEAYALTLQGRSAFKSDTLLHGDYCLPNIMLDDWRFSGFIDLGNGGVGDRHIDLYWGAWTLCFNLKTDMFRERFYDAYGRDRLDTDMIDLVSICEAFG